ncbi:hypothetical protein GGQ00_003066 [Salinibacter ruber]|uniref:hypothetical protein n=1 Tax=Salinibacter ruber TaxID=146919 RepID=UPI0021686989|nr:hypothetical protein [Salinibacter ruber]MCS4044606.1 hypothetical protein [Salinibacter ruber]
MAESKTECHILGAVEEPKKTARRIVEEAGEGAVVVDLSAGQLNWSHSPHQHLSEEAREATTWVNGQDLAPEIGDASRNAYIEWLSEAASQPIAHGASIKEWFTYRGEVSLWWFTGMSLKHPINQPQRWRFYQFFALKQLVSKIDDADAKWHIWGGGEESDLLCEVLPASTSVQYHEYEPTKKDSGLPLRTRIRKWLSESRVGETGLVLLDGIRSFGRTALRLLWVAHQTQNRASEIDETHPLHPAQRSKPLVLIQTKFPKSWEPVPGSTNLKISSAWYDHYFGDSPAELRSHGYRTGWLTSVEPESERAEQWKQVTQTQAIPDASPWMVLGYSDAWRIAWHRLKWALVYVYLFVYRQVHSKWTYEGVPVGHWFKDAYRWAWCTDAFADVERYRHACASLEPDAVLYRDEFYPSSGRRLSAGAKGNTQLVGVQHGMISREHTVYHWHEGDIETSNSGKGADHVHHAPVPDWFAAFGSHYVEQFDEWGGYPASRVVPVGGLRHDVLVDQFDLHKPSEARKAQKSALRGIYSLPEDRPALLLCTARKQTAGMWFEMIVEVLERQSLEAFVAVKLHQYHGGEEDVRRVAERHSFDAYEVYIEDVYPLMAASDVLIGSASTTVLEGRLFGLKCIAICATEEYQPYPFSRDELASAVTDAEDMGQALRETMEREGKTSGSLSRHLNNEDGNALCRLAEFLNTVIAGEAKTPTFSENQTPEHSVSA